MKIGIITLYYRSTNYGGNLQAYALEKYLNKSGYNAEQISYRMGSANVVSSEFIKSGVVKKAKILRNSYLKLIGCAKYILSNSSIYKEIQARDKAVLSFNTAKIKHSNFEYSFDNSYLISDDYDVFIAGSDQVWNTQWGINQVYFLGFVKNQKFKMSYAASLGRSEWTAEEMCVFKEYLSDYTAVSVREEDAVNILKEASPAPVEWVVDPTLLLTRKEWDKICAPRIVKDSYVFCYFLGTDAEERLLAEQYAKRKGLKLVSMPFLQKQTLLNKEFRKHESEFGDEQLYDISPEQFLSLIKYADCVFTDSFHATLFSGLYQKEYFVFGREVMGARIASLTKLYETEERFCNTAEKKKLEYLQAQKPIDYSRKLEKLLKLQRISEDYLKRNLRQAERQLNGI